MQTTPRTSFHPVSIRRTLRRVCVGSIALFAGIANGQSVVTKANNAIDLNLSSSWTGGVAPGPTDVALWDSNVAGPNSVLLGADLAWHGLQLTNPGGAVTIGAGNTLTLGGGGIDLSVATQDLTLNNGVTLGTAQSWNVGAGRTLTVTGSIGDAGAFLGLTKIGTGTLILAGANTYAGPTAVNGGTLLLNFAATTVYTDHDKIFDALKAGACGYLLKCSTPEEVRQAIVDVRRGGAPMSPEIARRVVQAFHRPLPKEGEALKLSRRETELLEHLAEGLANKEIADRMALSVETVRDYLKRIYDKLHVRSRTEAALKYRAASTSPARNT